MVQALHAELPPLLQHLEMHRLEPQDRTTDPFAATADVWQDAAWAPDLSAALWPPRPASAEVRPVQSGQHDCAYADGLP